MKLKSYLPILNWLSSYNKTTFRADIIAGATVVIMLVPQGMAYALLAGMPPIYGLYGGLIPLILYGMLGTSRQLSIGPVAISALLMFAGISQLAEPGTEYYIQLVLLTGLLVGVFQWLLSMLRMGFLINFLSHPVITGFTSAAAIIIAISQLKDLLGMQIPRFAHPHQTLTYAIKHLGEANWLAVVICLGSIVVIWMLRRLKKSFPGALFVVVAGTLIAWKFGLETRGLDIVKGVPAGLPSFILPEWTLENIRLVLPVVFTVTIVGIVESISIAKVLEAKHQDYVVLPNQELFALGISKIGGAFFQALPTSGSFSRSAVNDDSGAKTGMASIVTGILVGMTLLFFTPLFYYLPKAVLAAIILLAVKNLFDFKEAVKLWKVHRQDFIMMLITFIVTLGLGIEEGVVAGVIISILAVMYWSSVPHIVVLGNLPDSETYRNVKRFKSAVEPEGIMIVRFDNQLYFANTFHFKETIKNLIREKEQPPKVLILDASSMHDIDSSGLHALEELHDFLHRKGIAFNLCGVIGPVRDILRKSGLMNKIGAENQFMRIHDAVLKNKGNDKGWSKDAVQTNVGDEEE